jgi:hypothetical protein
MQIKRIDADFFVRQFGLSARSIPVLKDVSHGVDYLGSAIFQTESQAYRLIFIKKSAEIHKISVYLTQ